MRRFPLALLPALLLACAGRTQAPEAASVATPLGSEASSG